MKRIIKMINNERLNVKQQPQKACDSSSTDYCTSIDHSSCTINSYDYCQKDMAGCTNDSYDHCTSDYITCLPSKQDVSF